MRDSIWSRTLSQSACDELSRSDDLPTAADVAIVGAGMIGLCTALSLTRAGIKNIVVVDRGKIFDGAAGASAGGLWLSHECLKLGLTASLARRARELYYDLAEEFEFDLVRGGLIQLIKSGELDLARQKAAATREAGFTAELLSPNEIVAVEPNLRTSQSALYFPQDSSIHPGKFGAEIARELRRHGVRICTGHEVVDISEGVRTDHGTLEAGTIFVTAGAWTPLLTSLIGWEPPIRPIRGTLLGYDMQPPETLRTVVMGSRFYYWQLGCGPLAGGGTEVDAGFAEETDSSAMEDIHREFQAAFPGLAGLTPQVSWTGFRPYCADSHPVIGRVPGHQNVFVAAGHFRRGIQLGPLTGEMLATEYISGRAAEGTEAFRPERFASAVAPAGG